MNLVALKDMGWYFFDTFQGSKDGRGIVSYDFFMMSYKKAFGGCLENQYNVYGFDIFPYDPYDETCMKYSDYLGYIIIDRASYTEYDNYDWTKEKDENAENAGFMYYSGNWYANDGIGNIIKYSWDGKDFIMEGVVDECGRYVSGFMEKGVIYYTDGEKQIRAFDIEKGTDTQIYQCPSGEKEQDPDVYFSEVMKTAAQTDVVPVEVSKSSCFDSVNDNEIKMDIEYHNSVVKIKIPSSLESYEGEEYYEIDLKTMELGDCGNNRAAWIKACALEDGILKLYLGNTQAGNMLLIVRIADDCLKTSGRYEKDYFYVNDKIHSIYTYYLCISHCVDCVCQTDEDQLVDISNCPHEHIINVYDEKSFVEKETMCSQCGTASCEIARRGDPYWLEVEKKENLEWCDTSQSQQDIDHLYTLTKYPYDYEKSPDVCSTDLPVSTNSSLPAAQTLTPIPSSGRTPEIPVTPPSVKAPEAAATRSPVKTPEGTKRPLSTADKTTEPVGGPTGNRGLTVTQAPARVSITRSSPPIASAESRDAWKASGQKTDIHISVKQVAAKSVRIVWKKTKGGKSVRILCGREGSDKGKKIATVPMRNGQYIDKNNKLYKCWYQCLVLQDGVIKNSSSKRSITLYAYNAPKVVIQKKKLGKTGYLSIFLKKNQDCYIECYRKKGKTFRKLAIQNPRLYGKHRRLNIVYRKNTKYVICKFRIYRRVKGKKRYSDYTKPLKIRLG